MLQPIALIILRWSVCTSGVSEVATQRVFIRKELEIARLDDAVNNNVSDHAEEDVWPAPAVLAKAQRKTCVPAENQRTPRSAWSGTSGTHWGYGAWLTSKAHFMKTTREETLNFTPEGATFNYAPERSQSSMQTNDVLDFATVHMSLYIRAAELDGFDVMDNHTEVADASLQDMDSLGEYSLHQLKTVHLRRLSDRLVAHTEELATGLCDVGPDQTNQSRTVALIPYVARGFGDNPMAYHPLRELMLNATLWSVRQRFPRAVLATCNAKDSTVADRIPFWRTLVMETDANATGGCENLFAWSLHSLEKMLAGADGRDVDFVYYTEPDQVLTARNLPQLYAAIEAKDNETKQVGGIMVPHRLTAVPVPHDLGLPAAAAKLQPNMAHWRNSSVMPLPLNGGSCCLSESVSFSKGSCNEYIESAKVRIMPGSPDIHFMKLGSSGLPVGSLMELSDVTNPHHARCLSCVPSQTVRQCNDKPPNNRTLRSQSSRI